MNYEEFLERYLINREEFVFYYKDMEINICYGNNETFSYNICKNKKFIVKKEFISPRELVDNIEIDNIKFPELWDVLQ